MSVWLRMVRVSSSLGLEEMSDSHWDMVAGVRVPFEDSGTFGETESEEKEEVRSASGCRCFSSKEVLS